MTVFLVLMAFAAGFWCSERESRQKRRGWRPYQPSTNPLRDYK